MSEKNSLAKIENAVTKSDGLSRAAKITGTISTILILTGSMYMSLSTTTVLAVIFMPTVCSFYYRSTLPVNQQGSLEIIFWIYFCTATISTLILMAVQSGIGYALAKVMFGSDLEFFLNEYGSVSKESDIRDEAHRAARAEFASRSSYWIFLLCSTLIVAGLCEEVQKYISLAIARKYKQATSVKEYLVYGATTGLAYSTIENILFTMADLEASSGKLLLTLFERVFLGTPTHMLAAISIALKMARRDIEKTHIGIVGILMRSAICHGLYDFGVIAVSASRGHVGWVHPEDAFGLGCCLAWIALVVSVLVMLVRSEMKKIKQD